MCSRATVVCTTLSGPLLQLAQSENLRRHATCFPFLSVSQTHRSWPCRKTPDSQHTRIDVATRINPKTHRLFLASFLARFLPAPPMSFLSTGFFLRSFFRFLLGLGNSSIHGSTLHPDDFITLAMLWNDRDRQYSMMHCAGDSCSRSEGRPVFQRKVCDCGTGSTGSSSSTDPMNIRPDSLREVYEMVWRESFEFYCTATSEGDPQTNRNLRQPLFL